MTVRPETAGRCFLFLQGPLSRYFSEIASELMAQGQRVVRVNFCGNDMVDWTHSGAVSFRGKPGQWKPFLESLIAREQVTDVILHGDRRFYHKVAAGVCERAGVNVVASELGYLRPDWMTLEQNACSALSRFPNDAESIRQVAAHFPQVDHAIVYPGDSWRQVTQELRFTAFNTLFWPWFPHYLNHRPESRFEVYSGWLLARLTERRRRWASEASIGAVLKDGRPFHLVALQLDGDFQIREHSPFADMGEAIDYIAASFAAHADTRSCLVLKTHPLEYRFARVDRAVARTAEKYGLEDRIFRIDGGNLTELAGRASGFVTVNSSAGLEVLAAGCPVMSIMPTIYDVNGLTHQGDLDAFWTAGEKPDGALLNDLIRALAGALQLRGTIYNPEGLKAAAGTAARKLVAGTVNAHGAYVSPPPRLAKARKMGVIYDDQPTSGAGRSGQTGAQGIGDT